MTETSLFSFVVLSVFPVFIRTGFYRLIEKDKFWFFAVACLLYFLTRIFNFRKTVKKKFGAPEKLIICFLIWNILSAVFSEYGKVTVFGQTRHEGLVSVFLYVTSFLLVSRNGKLNSRLVFAMCCSAVVVSSFALLQELNSPIFYPEGYHFENFRSLSTIGHEDFYSGIASMFAPVLFFSFVFVNFKKADKLKKVLLYIAIVLLVYTVSYSEVYTGKIGIIVPIVFGFPFILKNKSSVSGYLLAFSAVLLGYAFYSRNKLTSLIFLGLIITYLIAVEFLPDDADFTLFRKLAVFLILTGVLAFLLFVFNYKGHSQFLFEFSEFMHGRLSDEAGHGRGHIWKTSVEIIKNHGLFGSGPGTFLGEFTHYSTYRSRYFFDMAHNDFLQIAVCTGLVGLLLYLSFVISLFVKYFKNIENTNALILISGIIGYLIYSFFVFSIAVVSPLFWVLAGLFVSETGNNQALKRRTKSLVIITTPNDAESLVNDIENDMNYGFLINGLILVDDEKTKEIAGIPVVSGFQNAADYICHEWVDDVLIWCNSLSDGLMILQQNCAQMGIAVHTNTEPTFYSTGKRNKQYSEEIGGRRFFTTLFNYRFLYQIAIKRLMDIIGSLIGIIFTIPILLIVGPVIFIKSPGPIIFRQRRAGKNGKIFTMYKIRSMYLDAESHKTELSSENIMKDDMTFKMDFDPRIIGNRILSDGKRKTGFGTFLRKTSLDEFPQFFNVLKGDMSLVGPRPPLTDELKKYSCHHKLRLSAKPGITGIWQVSGRNNVRNFEEILKLDTEYIQNFSIIFDLKILAKTLVAVFRFKETF